MRALTSSHVCALSLGGAQKRGCLGGGIRAQGRGEVAGRGSLLPAFRPVPAYTVPHTCVSSQGTRASVFSKSFWSFAGDLVPDADPAPRELP